MAVELEDQGNLARERRSSCLEEPERSGIGAAPRLDGELEADY
jgi:hypothetical protein